MIRVEVGDLAFQNTTAIVRPTNTFLEPISSALVNLERIAGLALTGITPAGELEIGAATVTAAGDLETEFIIHAVICSTTAGISETGVRRAILSVFERVSAWEFASLAMSPIGVGPGGLILESAADIMADTIVTHVKENVYPAEVCIVVNSDDELAVFQSRFT